MSYILSNAAVTLETLVKVVADPVLDGIMIYFK